LLPFITLNSNQQIDFCKRSIDKAGNYGDKAIKEFLAFAPIQYDFYLDYEMQNPAHSPKWRIYYPNNLG
jgi:hypothetical protein